MEQMNVFPFCLHFIYFILITIPFFSPFRSHERTQEELELVFEELLHIAALSHLSTSIKRELASIIVFESHAQAGTICKYSIFSCYLFIYSFINIC